MSTLERRLHKLEEVLLPKPWQPVCMLTEPASDAQDEEWADYQRQVEAAKARGDFVIVVAPMKPREGRRTEKGVTYCAGELDASLLQASRLPSALGNNSLLVDVLKDAMGNVIGPVARC
ncbi:hypothetical protein [Accumulibacter sp.]|uniref:hypothetical protein n=1 Tax=Accumulibacter sp. TaxID=2053492 RepID=UPI001A5C2147|nr:hypothetical protein [Accumulibacter sp.]MBL8374916.1 hypothetical protein [Accumulibacter sp.]